MKVKNSQNIKNTNFNTNPIGTQYLDLCEDILVGEIIKFRTKTSTKRAQRNIKNASKLRRAPPEGNCDSATCVLGVRVKYKGVWELNEGEMRTLFDLR